VDYVYLWADGIHVNIRLEEHELCLLVLIGVRADGRRGMRAPVLAVGDGALGFWGALREVFPDTREQRCSLHWRAVNAPHLVALVLSGATFVKGKLLERPNEEAVQRP
jgi:transposase-like protein